MNLIQWALIITLAFLISCGGPAGKTASGANNSQAGNTSGQSGQTGQNTGSGQEATAEQIKAGNDVFISAGCSSCHKIGDEGASIGPNLTLVGQRKTYDELKAWLKDPKAVNPNATMPTPNLTDEQIASLARYLSMLK